MIEKEISKQLTHVGVEYRPVSGGISQVISLHSTIFDGYDFLPSVSAAGSGKLLKLATLTKSYLRFLGRMFGRRVRLVHVHTASGISFWRTSIFVRTAKMFGRKVVLHVHGGAFRVFESQHSRRVRNVLRKADCIIALSHEWAEYFNGLGVCAKVEVVPNPVGTPKLNPARRPGVLSMCFLGKICDDKGVFDLLDVIARNSNRWKGWLKLYIGGNGETERLERSIAELGIADIVEFVGWVGPDKKIDLLNMCDALVLPSYYEGLPMCILEAMSYGEAVLTTDVGGIPRIVEHGYNGLMFKPGDKDGMQAAIDRMLDDPEAVKQMGEAGSRKVGPHSLDAVEARLKEIYSSLLK